MRRDNVKGGLKEILSRLILAILVGALIMTPMSYLTGCGLPWVKEQESDDDDDDDDDDYDDDEEDDEDNDGEYVPYVDFTPLYERHESIYDNNTFYIDDNTKKEIKKKRIKSIFRNHGRLPIMIDPNELYKMSLRGVIHKVSLSGFKNIKSKGMNNLRCEETSQEGMVQRIIVDNTVMSYFGQEFPYKSTVIIEYN